MMPGKYWDESLRCLREKKKRFKEKNEENEKPCGILVGVTVMFENINNFPGLGLKQHNPLRKAEIKIIYDSEH